MIKIKKILILFLLVFFICPTITFAFGKKEVNVYLFYSETCPHCAAEHKYLNSIKDKYDLNIYSYEISNPDSVEKLEKISKYLDVNVTGVPYTVINNTAIVGFGEGMTEDTLLYHIKKARKRSFVDKAGMELGVVEKEETNNNSNNSNKEEDNNTIINIPIIGELNLKNVSLPIVSILIGLIDGFNPCAMWILLFLISTLIGMKDKKRLWALGLTFLITSSLVYLAFMLSWLSFAKFIGTITWFRMLIAVVALVGAAINLNSYLKTLKEEDGCTVVEAKKRKKIFKKIKEFTSKQSFVLALLGIMLLAALVNILELACSAGLPVVFTGVLSMNNLSTLEYVLYIGLYILFFMLDDIFIFAVAVKSFELTGISTKYSKYSHLIGGILMLIIGILLVLKPEWLMFNF